MMNKFTLGSSMLLAFVLCASCSRPIANFRYSGETKVLETINFENTSEKAETYEWEFGDGKTSEEVSPKHVYKSSGNYVVRLKATKEGKTKVKEERIIVDAPEECLIELETTFGNMLIQLYDITPNHQENFTKLVEQGFYDSLLFHRVMDSFMIQGGDPDSKKAKAGQPLGMGGPGYKIDAEFVDTLVHLKGTLAAARQPDQVNPQKKSSGSQFYIVQGRPWTDDELNRIEAQKGIRYSKEHRDAYKSIGGTPLLDKEYTIFGKVIEGIEVVDEIVKVQTDERNRPLKDIFMKMRLIR